MQKMNGVNSPTNPNWPSKTPDKPSGPRRGNNPPKNIRNSILVMLMALVLGTGYSPLSMSKDIGGPDEEALSSGKELVLKSELPKEEESELARLRDSAGKAACPGAFPLPIALSVSRHGDHSYGHADTTLSYPYTTTNEGSPTQWNGSTFIAPCNGLYFFSLSIEKDSFYPGTAMDDDIWVYLKKCPNAGNCGSGTDYGMAWAGSGHARSRETGADNVILRLLKGDSVQTRVHGEGGGWRYLIYNSLTIHRIGN